MTHSNLYIFITALVWQHFVSRFANFFVTFFVVRECLADWEKITSNGFLHTDPEMLLHDTHMVRISIPNVKWVKTRDEFGVSYAWEACLKKMTKYLHFCDGIFRKQSILSRKFLKIQVCGLFLVAHKILLNIPMYFLPHNYAPVSQTFVYKRTVLKKIRKFWKS